MYRQVLKNTQEIATHKLYSFLDVTRKRYQSNKTLIQLETRIILLLHFICKSFFPAKLPELPALR